MQPVHLWSPMRKRLMVAVFLGIHIPLTVLAAASVLLGAGVGGAVLLIALGATLFAAVVTLPVVYALTREAQPAQG